MSTSPGPSDQPRSLAEQLLDRDGTGTQFRTEAAIRLGDAGSEGSVAVLRDALINDPSQVVRGYAAEALGKIGGLTSLAALHEGVEANENARNLMAAMLDGIATIGSATSTANVLPLLHHGHFTTRRRATQVLKQIADPTVVPALITALDGPDSYVRVKVAEALAEVGDPAALEPMRAAAKRTGPWRSRGLRRAIDRLETRTEMQTGTRD